MSRAEAEKLGQGEEWQGRQGSNPRPTVLETAALPTELHPCLGGCYFTTGPDKYQEMGTALRP